MSRASFDGLRMSGWVGVGCGARSAGAGREARARRAGRGAWGVGRKAWGFFYLFRQLQTNLAHPELVEGRARQLPHRASNRAQPTTRSENDQAPFNQATVWLVTRALTDSRYFNRASARSTGFFASAGTVASYATSLPTIASVCAREAIRST